ncbi:hypothetical protein H4R24_005414, partial [Coemansia sp. RSA 988]
MDDVVLTQPPAGPRITAPVDTIAAATTRHTSDDNALAPATPTSQKRAAASAASLVHQTEQ